MKTVGRNQVEDAAMSLSHLAIPPLHQWLLGFQDSKHAREHVMAFMLPEILRVDRLRDAVVVEESKGTVLLILACCVGPGPRPRGNWFISSFAKSQGCNSASLLRPSQRSARAIDPVNALGCNPGSRRSASVLWQVWTSSPV